MMSNLKLAAIVVPITAAIAIPAALDFQSSEPTTTTVTSSKSGYSSEPAPTYSQPSGPMTEAEVRRVFNGIPADGQAEVCAYYLYDFTTLLDTFQDLAQEELGRTVKTETLVTVFDDVCGYNG